MARSPKWTCETCGFETDSTAEAKRHADENDDASIADTKYDPGIRGAR
jgi:hypothetical protein